MKERYRAFWRTDVGRAITRLYRRLPRVQIFAALYFSIGVLTLSETPKYRTLLSSSAQLATYDAHSGWLWLTVQASLLTVGISLAGASVVLYGIYGSQGMRFIVSPRPSIRRDMKRSLKVALKVFGASCACAVLLPFSNLLVDQQLANQNRVIKAAHELSTLRQQTVQRLFDEQRGGHWWADPNDSDEIKDIKSALKQTGLHGRRQIMAFIELRLKYPREPKNPVQ